MISSYKLNNDMDSSLKFKDLEKSLYIFQETAYAEHGSALEMLAACKTIKKNTHVYGYFKHASDEYRHTKIFLSLLGSCGKKLSSREARKWRYNASGLLKKGYISNKGYLVEIMKLKDFIAFVYTNELLAKESFSKILKLVGTDSNDGYLISNIMKDELIHHGMAKEYFLNHYPALQPWQLRLYRLREALKNKSRKFYLRNLKLLGKILNPLYLLLSYMVGLLLLFLDLSEFQREGKNLMEIKSSSIF